MGKASYSPTRGYNLRDCLPWLSLSSIPNQTAIMSGGSNNATIAIPGQDWQLMWPYQFDNFQLDIVGFLAVLGEGSILSTAQVSALSHLFYLPRLLPAPQALLRTSRPTSLPSVQAVVTAVHSGNKKEHIHHVANVLL
jgi:hypothetical protein